MGNDLHASNTKLPVLPQTPLRLADTDPVISPASALTTEPRPITISLPSPFATTGATQTMRGENPTHLPRTVPIASPSADMSTPSSGLPRVPALSTVPTLPTLPTLPSLPPSAAAAPVPLLEPELVDVVHAVVEQEASRFVHPDPQHPMAHLMPPRTKPTEAQLRANELRASNKKKGRRTKLLVVVAVVAIGAFAGPPLAAWVVTAINESGATTDQTEPDSTDVGDDTGNANGGVGTLLDDIDTLTSVVAENNTANQTGTDG